MTLAPLPGTETRDRRGRRLSLRRLWAVVEGRETECVRIDRFLTGWEYNVATGYHPGRVKAADVNYPVLLDPDGRLLDGRHRMIYLRSLGLTDARAVRVTWDDIEAAVIGDRERCT